MASLKRFAIIFSISLCASIPLAAQNDCELTISRALEEFNSGHFYIIPSLLSPCLDQMTNDQKQRAYILLTQTYLLLDDPIGAKQSFLNVLKANPEFQTDTAVHPIDVIYLSKKFTATSIFSWFAKAGPNASFVRKIYDLNAFESTSVTQKYKIRMGYQASVGGDLNINENLMARAELMYASTSFKHQISNFFNNDVQTVTDKQSWISIPVSFIYSDAVGKYRPYGYLGYSFHYLLGDRTNVIITNNKPLTNKEGERDNSTNESPTLDSKFKKNQFNQSIIAGGGLKIKIGLDFIFFDLRYNVGLKNVAARSGTYGDGSVADLTSSDFVKSLELPLRYGDVGDYFRLDNLSLSIGFLRPLYKPRELKHARTRSVLRKIKR